MNLLVFIWQHFNEFYRKTIHTIRLYTEKRQYSYTYIYLRVIGRQYILKLVYSRFMVQHSDDDSNNYFLIQMYTANSIHNVHHTPLFAKNIFNNTTSHT